MVHIHAFLPTEQELLTGDRPDPARALHEPQPCRGWSPAAPWLPSVCSLGCHVVPCLPSFCPCSGGSLLQIVSCSDGFDGEKLAFSKGSPPQLDLEEHRINRGWCLDLGDTRLELPVWNRIICTKWHFSFSNRKIFFCDLECHAFS